MQVVHLDVACFADCLQVPGADLEINPRLESLCLSMTEHALEGKEFPRGACVVTGLLYAYLL